MPKIQPPELKEYMDRKLSGERVITPFLPQRHRPTRLVAGGTLAVFAAEMPLRLKCWWLTSRNHIA